MIGKVPSWMVTICAASVILRWSPCSSAAGYASGIKKSWADCAPMAPVNPYGVTPIIVTRIMFNLTVRPSTSGMTQTLAPTALR